MTGQGNHIISKFKWENSFDRKEKSTELQQRISNWSNTKMPKEMASIFDRICPASQTWSIQSLILDLGNIDYDNLEDDLSLKLYTQLSDKLIEIIFHSDKQGHNIELLDTDNSQLSMLKHYFLTGSMPWNYKITDNSVNKIVALQFKNNRYNVINMLYEVGEVDENVRKRIAWQIDETNILKIIEGLEPSNHNQIIKFSEELTQIQQQEAIVPANKNDFKRNLWFWILNYLFTDRGTIFNKVAFMKSSIKQMSNHYNVAYSELLNMIEMAIDYINVNSSTKADFILVLKMLTKENESFNTKKSLTIAPKPDYWLVLAKLFSSPSIRKENNNKNEFNELVIALSKENKTKFRELFFSLGESTHFWSPVVQDLKKETLESMFYAVLPVKSEMIVESIYFVEKLCVEMNLKLEPNALWEIGMFFVLSHKNSTFDNKVFLNYTLNELSKKSKEFRENVLDQLITVKIPASSKTITTLEIYTNLTALLIDDISEKKERFYATRFNDLLAELIAQIKSNEIDKEHSVSIQKLIIKYIIINPSQTLDLLIQYKDKELLKQLFPFILNKHHADLWIKKSNKSKSHLLQTLDRISTETNSSINGILTPLQDNLYMIGVKLMVLHPEYNSLRFLEVLLEKMASLITPSQKAFFEVFLQNLFSHKKINNSAFVASDLVKIKNKLVLHKSKASIEKKKLPKPMPMPTTIQEKRDMISINGHNISITTLFEWIEQSIKSESLKITQNNQVFKLKQLITIALEISPKELRAVLLRVDINENRIRLLKSCYNWRNFSLWIANDSNTTLQETIETLRSLYDFIDHFMGTKNSHIQEEFWQQTWEIIRQNKNIQSIQKSFVKHWLDQVFKENETNSHSVIVAIQSHKIKISPILKNILMEYTTTFSTITSETTVSMHEDMIRCEKMGLLEELYLSLIIQKKIPAWYNNAENVSVSNLLQELLAYYPTQFIALFKQNSLPQLQKQQLSEWIDLKKIVPIIQNFNKNKEQLISIIERFHSVLGQISLQGIKSREIQNILFNKLITAWTESNWSIIAIENIWQELIWEICTKRNIAKKDLFLAIEKIKYSLPPSIQIAFEQITKANASASASKQTGIPPVLKKQLEQKSTLVANSGGIAVKNAGIVLLNNYLEMLIERLELLHEKRFKDKASQLDAVHYLQYVVTGLTKTEEALLPLNKLLCGLPLDTPIMEGINITEEQENLITGLINAAISHWPSVGDTSVLGFRGNWLVRDGLLIEKEDRWELIVENRVYDLLIHKSPFSFSIIKYAWMEKPLHVTWPY